MPVRAVVKLVTEILGFVVAIVTLVAWFTGKADLPALVGSHKSHAQNSPTASTPTRAGTAPPKKPATTASPTKKPNPLSVAVYMGSMGRVGTDRFKGEFEYEFVIKLNGKEVYSDCSANQHLIQASTGEDRVSNFKTDCSVTGTEYLADSTKQLAAGVYTIRVDVTLKQGYKASGSHAITLVK